MIKILVLSDNHGDYQIFDKLKKREKYDYIIHLGDSQLDKNFIIENTTYFVEGNMDFFSAKLEQKFTINDIKFKIMHGHTLGFRDINDNEALIKHARQENVDILLYGHTHIPNLYRHQSTTILNPGSTRSGRSSYGQTYGVITIIGSIANFEIKNV